MTITASPVRPAIVYYCKAGIPTGLTVRVLHAGALHQLRGVQLHAATAEMIDGNSPGIPKRSGARCVLLITAGQVTLIP